MKNAALILRSTLVLTILLVLNACTEDALFTELSTENATAHVHRRSCSTQHHTQKLLQNPDYKSAYEARIARFEEAQSNNIEDRSACANPTIIPVAVHYQGLSNPNTSCLIQLAQSQIDVLNEDYQANNSDITKWTNGASSNFPSVNHGETCIQFVLANQNHPSGFGVSNGDPAVTFNKTSGDDANAWSGYINIFVRSTGLDDALGYAPLGGSGNGDGIVMNAAAFGKGSGCTGVRPGAPYNLGRTLTHEMGHYLYLNHIWGDYDTCNSDDGVSDTPSQKEANYSCPNIGKSSCSTDDLFMNYMDYVNDACMYMFTQGQSSRMMNYVTANLQHVVNKGTTVVSGNTGGGGNGGGGTTCAAPSEISVSSTAATSVLIDWEDVPSATKYRVNYSIVGTAWTSRSVTTSKKALSGLQAGATYQYKVKSQCPSGWTAWGATRTFTVSGGTGGGGNNGCSKNSVTLELVLDNYGSETSWELTNNNYNVLQSGGPFQDGQAGTKVTKEFCLNNGCYDLYVDDAYSDGICCSYGNGYFQLKDASGQVVAQQAGNFGKWGVIEFCVSNNTVTASRQQADPQPQDLAQKTK